MKINKIVLLILVALALDSYVAASAQSGKLPPFSMVQVNGKVFKAQDLPVGKPIVIIYFSPECDHCEKLTTELIKRINEFKKASIAMITYLPVEKVSKFVKDYKLSKYTNIHVGTEGNAFFVRNYYKIITMPFMALYNKSGDLQMLYPNEGSLPDLSKRLNKL